MKIDMSFVRRIKSQKGRVMLQTIVDMGKAMNLDLVAEGVEDQETADLLYEMGVHFLQGFYFSPARPDEDIREYILQSSKASGKLLTLKNSA